MALAPPWRVAPRLFFLLVLFCCVVDGDPFDERVVVLFPPRRIACSVGKERGEFAILAKRLFFAAALEKNVTYAHVVRGLSKSAGGRHCFEEEAASLQHALAFFMPPQQL